jgi:hypothetical protein
MAGAFIKYMWCSGYFMVETHEKNFGNIKLAITKN